MQLRELGAALTSRPRPERHRLTVLARGNLGVVLGSGLPLVGVLLAGEAVTAGILLGVQPNNETSLPPPVVEDLLLNQLSKRRRDG
jgi:hypothetical protein